MNEWKRIVCCALALLCVCACFTVGMPHASAEERDPSGIERPAAAADLPSLIIYNDVQWTFPCFAVSYGL